MLSQALPRGLRLAARSNQCADIAGVLRAALRKWPGSTPQLTEPHGTGGGSVTFEMRLCGRAFALRIEPIDDPEAERIFSPAVPSQRDEESAGRSGVGDGGD